MHAPTGQVVPDGHGAPMATHAHGGPAATHEASSACMWQLSVARYAGTGVAVSPLHPTAVSATKETATKLRMRYQASMPRAGTQMPGIRRVTDRAHAKNRDPGPGGLGTPKKPIGDPNGSPGFQLPLRRFETGPYRRRVVTAASAASREVACASECCEQRSARPIGLPDPALALPFPARLRGLPAAAVPHDFRRRSILSCASSLLRVLRDRPPVASRRRAPPLGFCPLRDISRRSPPPDGLPHPGCGHPRSAAFRPRRFARPRRLPPPPALRVCFTPLPRPGFSLQGVSPAHSRTSSSLAVALLTFKPAPCPQFYPWAPEACPRLQGLAPYADP